jgi:hypothetical protein
MLRETEIMAFNGLKFFHQTGSLRTTTRGGLNHVHWKSRFLSGAGASSAPCSTVEPFSVIRAKSNLKYRRIYSHPVDKTTGVICDQSVLLKGYYQAQHYSEKLRRVKYYDATTEKTLVFLTNNFALPALTIADLYRCRWQVELFFKWIKQNLRIKTFYGTSENAVKAAIMKKRAEDQCQSLHNSTGLERHCF